MKLSQLVSSVQAIRELSALKLPALLAFKIAKLINVFNESLKMFEETRNKKLEEFGKKEMTKEKGQEVEKFTGRYVFEGDNREKFNKEMDEVLAQEIVVDIPEIKIEQLKNADGKELEISANMLAQLDWLIKQ